MHLEPRIGEMVDRIVARFAPEKVILFGSYARGTAGAGSDVDVLVVLPIEGTRRKKAVEMYAALAGIGISKDIIVATPEDLVVYGDLPGAAIAEAIREGKVVYERPR